MDAILKELRRKIKPRPSVSHKGNYGRVAVLGGSKGLAGAAHLAAMGALRSGAGLVSLGVPEKVYGVLARREAEVMVKPFASTPQGTFSRRSLQAVLGFLKNQDVLALGPGLSVNAETRKFVLALLARCRLPVVLDADGLNAVAGRTSVLKQCAGRAVLTPHPGEFVRLFGGRLSPKNDLRLKRAREAAQAAGVIVVLKGHRTVVAAPDGRVFVNRTGNPGMATAGSGDVLTGIIAALAGQGLSLWDAARFGVYAHGLAGDIAAQAKGEIGLIAGDILEALPAAFKKILRRQK